jgi:hypothetical protein
METSPPDNVRRVQRTWLVGGILFVALGLVTWGLCQITPPPTEMPEAGVVLDLPETVLDLHGEKEDVTESEKVILPPDTQFAKRVYKGADPGFITCQIVLSGADRRSIHRPEACLRGQGWTIKNGGTIPIELSDGTDMKVMKLIIDRPVETKEGGKGTLRSIYLYWFASKTILTPLHSERLLHTYLDLLLHNRSNRWAYIIVSAPVLQGFTPGGLNEEQTLDLLKRFIAEAAPKFQRVTPSTTASEKSAAKTAPKASPAAGS